MADVTLIAVPGYYDTAATVIDGAVCIYQQPYSNMWGPYKRSVRIISPDGSTIYETHSPQMKGVSSSLGEDTQVAVFPDEWTIAGYFFSFSEYWDSGFSQSQAEHRYRAA